VLIIDNRICGESAKLVSYASIVTIASTSISKANIISILPIPEPPTPSFGASPMDAGVVHHNAVAAGAPLTGAGEGLEAALAGREPVRTTLGYAKRSIRPKNPEIRLSRPFFSTS
jgi:hypothetical protein